jgi:uncharacterized membrane protein (DUF373 family)
VEKVKGISIRVIYEKIIDAVFGVILFFIVIGIAIGAAQLFITTWDLLKFEGITGHYIGVITDVLTLYVLIELARSLIEHFKNQKLQIVCIVDAAIVFVIREILIDLFKDEVEPQMLYAFSAFLLVLGVLRIGSMLVYQRQQRMTGHEIPS